MGDQLSARHNVILGFFFIGTSWAVTFLLGSSFPLMLLSTCGGILVGNSAAKFFNCGG